MGLSGTFPASLNFQKARKRNRERERERERESFVRMRMNGRKIERERERERERESERERERVSAPALAITACPRRPLAPRAGSFDMIYEAGLRPLPHSSRHPAGEPRVWLGIRLSETGTCTMTSRARRGQRGVTPVSGSRLLS